MRISVWESKELQALLLGLRGFDRELRKQIRQHTKKLGQPEWQSAIAQHAETRLEHRVLVQTARVAVSDQNVQLKSASVGRSLSGGLKPSESYAAAEWGADQNVTRTYDARSSKGKQFSVTRHTRRQLRPRNERGYAVMPAVASFIPRMAALWTQTAVRTFHETIEKASK